MPGREPVKLYFDYKSPFAYLAMAPAFALPGRYAIELRWIPYQLRIKGQGERSVYSEWKVRYSYLDARRAANQRGGFAIRGPRKVYDSTPALVGGLLAQRDGFFSAYTEAVFPRFFEHRLEIDDPQAVGALIEELGSSAADYLDYLAGEGALAFEACVAEGLRDHVFGVPIFLFRDEPFWGQDRIPLLEQRLREAGLEL
ncbi:MAG TPA: DsbA family protein [Myxococcota bacterium]|jgi:2-hydroxychromene-2-carboxylate isomerase